MKNVIKNSFLILGVFSISLASSVLASGGFRTVMLETDVVADTVQTTGNVTLNSVSGSTSVGTTTISATSKLVISNQPLGDGTTATTTVDFGDYATTTSAVCFNVNNSAGAAISFYFDGANTMVVENNRCR